MVNATLESWRIHIVEKNGVKQTLFSGFVAEQKVLFFCKGFDYDTESIISQTDKKYRLGIPHPEYEKQFPNAKKKFLDALRKRKK